MKRARWFTAGVVLLSALLTVTLLVSHRWEQQALQHRWPAHRQLAARLGVTDLSLWSEARYTRHPSQTDLFSAFQNAPGALDHFPAGSIVPPAVARPTTTLTVQRRSSD